MQSRLSKAAYVVFLATLISSCVEESPALPTTTTTTAVAATVAVTTTQPLPTATTTSTTPPSALDLLRERELFLPSLSAAEECPLTPVGDEVQGVAQTYGTGPVYATLGSRNSTVELYSDMFEYGLYYTKVLWSFTGEGPVLIRGHQLDGPADVGFEPDEPVPSGRKLSELTITTDPPEGQTGFAATSVLIPGPGCYAFQVDTPSSTDVIVFKAVER
jgi:hypothetical protein